MNFVIHSYKETGFARFLKGHFNQLKVAYRGMVVEPEHLEVIVSAAVVCALQVYEGDQLAEDLRFPTIDQLEGMKFAGGCATCCFVDSFASFLAKFGHGDDTKPKLAKGVDKIAGVNIRILNTGNKLRVIVGYLAHENIFEHAFHGDLIARLQPLLTPELVHSVIQNHLVMLEISRRILVHGESAIMEAYGFSSNDIATLANTNEAEIREELRRQREVSPVNRLWSMLGKLFGEDVQVL